MDDNTTDRTQQIDRIAADGRALAPAANTAGDFLNMIEDGQFSADLQASLVDLAAEMADLVAATGNKQKGRVTITVDLLNDGGVFTAVGKYAVKKPELKRRATLLWTDEQNRFTRSQPRQGGFFGVREVVNLGTGEVRTVR